MRRQRNMAQGKEQIKTPEKELNEMEISNLSDVEFKTLFIRMLKEINSIKKTQSEMKDILMDIKNNYRESTVEWIKPRIKSKTWNIRKQKTNNQNTKKKKESKKKMRIV